MLHENDLKMLFVSSDEKEHKSFRNLIKYEKLAYDYTIAETLKETENLIGKKDIDIVLLNHIVSDGNAFDLFPKLQNTSIVFLTESRNPEFAVQALKSGAAEYILKDVDHLFLKFVPLAVESIVNKRNSELEKEKIKSDLILSEKSAALGRVSAGLAHEINNPASVVQNDLNLIKTILRSIPPSTEKDKLLEIVDRDLKAIKRVTELVLAIKSSHKQAKWNKIDINSEIDFQLTLLQDKFRDAITIEKQYGDIRQINSYGSEIGQVILNLLTNAIGAIEQQGKVSINTSQIEDKAIEIKISDTGKGIKKSDQEKIFDPFFTTKDVGEGTGLGLSMAKQIVEKHNGSIYLSSTKEGAGSTFVVSLPIENGKN